MRRSILAVLAVLLAAAAPGALAQGWTPDRPVRIVVPFPPGGATDLIARLFAKRASRDLPQRWVVENRAGANGKIGMAHVASSAPDGHTLGACTIGNGAINASICARMPGDIERDLVPVFWSGSVMNALPGEANAEPEPRARLAAHVAVGIARWRGAVEANRIERIAE